MKIPKVILLFLILLVCMISYSQNHVANPSFEELSDCPDDFFQIYKAPPWFSPSCEPLRPDRHGYAILFTSKNPCVSDLTGVPKNVWCYQQAHSGVSYAGIEVLSTSTVQGVYRQYLETKLQWPLEAGKKYFFTMFYNLCYPENVSSDIICFKPDLFGAYFSSAAIDKNPNCQVLRLSPQVYDAGKKIPAAQGWKELSGCITAKGNENYLTIGNFAENNVSNCSAIDSIGYYILIDDVALIPMAEVSKQIDTVICKSDGWTMNAQQLREEYVTFSGWKYQWTDGSNDMERKFSVPGNYTLVVSYEDCFSDTYNFKIGTIDCICKDYIPAAFTPNGDNVNDRFVPHIICDNRQISGYKFSIFNRWGKKIFSANSEMEAWDGKYKGQSVPAGEYIYLLEFKVDHSEEIKKRKGTILVLR